MPGARRGRLPLAARLGVVALALISLGVLPACLRGAGVDEPRPTGFQARLFVFDGDETVADVDLGCPVRTERVELVTDGIGCDGVWGGCSLVDNPVQLTGASKPRTAPPWPTRSRRCRRSCSPRTRRTGPSTWT